jgi:hypothetical protein
MSDDLDITPAGQATPQVRLYKDSLDAIDLSQPHNAQPQSTIEGAAPTASNAGIGPVDLILRGDWVGADASVLADRLESILNDQSVERVDVAGANIATRYDGTYYLAESPGNVLPAPQTDLLFSYEIRLVEE